MGLHLTLGWTHAAVMSAHAQSGLVDWHDPSVLSRLLLYGDEATLREMADAVSQGEPGLLAMLADTARSNERLVLRARCVEVLGLALAAASDERTAAILSALLGVTAT